MSALVELQNVTKVYQGIVQTTALKNVSMIIEEGSFVSLMGASGSGKSTLLNMLGLLDVPSKGVMSFGGKRIDNLSKRERNTMRKFNVGFVFQDFNLINDLTVYENVELPLHYLKRDSKFRKDKVESILSRLSIIHKRNAFPQELSGGQQQRVALARAIVIEPKLILADEPTGNLDSEHGSDVMELLSEQNENGTSIVMATHNYNDAAYSRKIIRMLDGSILSENISQNAI